MEGFDESKIVYGLVARSTRILAEYTNLKGNFPRIALTILEKIPPNDHKGSYAYEQFNFHFEVSDEIIFMVLSDYTFSATLSFKFLEEIKKEWKEKYGDKGKQVKNAYAMNRGFRDVLKKKMNYFNNDPQANKIKMVRQKVEAIKHEVVESIDLVVQRGETLDVLEDKTKNLSYSGTRFKSKARRLNFTMILQNLKIIILILIVLLMIAGGIFLYFCGGVHCLGIGTSSSGSGSKTE